MSADTVEKLVYMANQIARNLAHDADPVSATADHIDAFWTPRMKGQLFARGLGGLDPVADAALRKLAAGAEVAPHTRATNPAAHGSDAG